MVNKSIKYFCNKCGSTKSPKVVTIFPNIDKGDDKTREDIEVIKSFTKSITSEGKEIKKDFRARQLECNHFIDYYTPGFDSKDSNSENLSEEDTRIIREKLQAEMKNLGPKEIEAKLLFHVAKYKALFVVSSKQQKQAKYGLQVLEELKEKFSEQLKDDSERQRYNMLFDHVFNPGKVSDKTIKRELTKAEKKAEGEVHGKVAGVDAATALLKKLGYSNDEMKKLFSKQQEEDNK